MKYDLKKHQDKFIYKFNEHPTFKAGIHFGEVTTGEIGRIKKDIVFTGDTLNTTARIQSLCNEYSVDILVSFNLLNILDLDSRYLTKLLGNRELRGKKEVVELYTIQKQPVANTVIING